MRIPENIIDEIRANADIVEVIGEDLQLKASGSNFKALSPFTSEKTPSFVVSRQKQIFKCFSSGKGGNVFTYLMEMHGMSFIEAAKHLAEKYGVSLPKDSERESNEKDDINAKALQALEILTDFYQRQLGSPKGKAASDYLSKRGVEAKAQKDFKLGYAPDNWGETYEFMRSMGYEDEVLELTGGFGHSKRGGMYDRFRGRLIFPISNYLGKVIGFGGRDLSGKEDTAKYINSPQTQLYNKSRVLYGLDQARDSIRSNGEVILAEGYMDVIALHQHGFDNAVSTSGTALTQEMVKLIKRYCNKLYLVFDTDKAGINAAMRALPTAIEGDIETKVVTLEEGEDPDSILKKKGETSFRLYLRKALSPISYLHSVHEKREELTSPSSKANAIKEATGLIQRMGDPISRELYVQEISRVYGIPENTVRESLGKSKNANRQTDENEQIRTEERPKSKNDVLEQLSGSDRFLITLALESYENLEVLEREYNLHSEIFSSDSAAVFFDNISNLSGSVDPLSALMLSEACEQAYKEAAAELILSSLTMSPRWKDYAFIDELKDMRLATAEVSVKKVLMESLEREKEELKTALKDSESINSKSLAMLKRIQEIDALRVDYQNQIKNMKTI